MANTLCIDWGNTLVKASIFDSENKMLQSVQQNPQDAPAAIDELVNQHQPASAILCATGYYSHELEQALTQKLTLLKLSHNTSLPIINAYSSPETLGMDRIALAVGAQQAFPDRNNLVVSLGTCVTYNFVMKNKAFRGGAISPGLHMRLRSMHEYTDKLPEVGLDGEILLLGYDTATSMRSGAVYGMISEIEGMIAAFKEQYPDVHGILTGGDAVYFQSKFKTGITTDTDLLMKGLNIILRYNLPVIH